MKISVLGSGSSGNSTFVEVDNLKILIDVGFNCKQTMKKLESIGEKLEDINAILITHEHSDHIGGLDVIARKYEVPVYITKESYDAAYDKLAKIDKSQIKFITNNFLIDNKINVSVFDVNHDAARTVGFKLETELGKTMSISTDIGCVNNLIREYFKNVDVMIIESNYDLNKLINCDYPWTLKERIKSKNGHLSNLEAARFIKELSGAHLQKVFLAHVSKESNDEKLISNTMEEEFDRMIYRPKYEILKQNESSKIFNIE